VRLKIGTQIYDRTLTPVTDATEKAAVLAANARKYPAGEKSRIHVFRVEP
jgi:hypothetical protein